MIRLQLVGKQRASWEGLLDIADIYPHGWAVVGGQLTFLHLIDRGFGNPRPTADLDAAIDVRGHHPDAVQRFVAAMREVGFSSAGVTPNGHQHRWVRGKAQIDILIPSGLDPQRSDGNRQDPGRVSTLESRGLQFAIDRTTRMPVTINGRVATINAPDLIGAIYGKCSALLNHLDRNPERHLSDVVLLASVTDRADRQELGRLSNKELARLRAGLSRAIADQRIKRYVDAVTHERAQGFLATVKFLLDPGSRGQLPANLS